jgi:hypothetical protein
MPEPGLANIARARGRSLEHFCDQPTPSRLLPAEDRLLVAVVAGTRCDLSRADAIEKIRAELDARLTHSDVMRLAAEVIASPGRLFQTDDKDEERKSARIALERRVEAFPYLVQEFLRELQICAEVDAEAPDLKSKVVDYPSLLLPIFSELRKRYASESGYWRHVDPADPEIRVRAGFLRFLALGGDEGAPVHEKGLQLKGAYVDGEFDLTFCDKVVPIDFENCFFTKPVSFSGASLQRLRLPGCRVPALGGIRCQIGKSVICNDGFTSWGPVNLNGAVIGGMLSCDQGDFYAGLDCSYGMITGDVQLSHSHITGRASADGATIGGNVVCRNCTIRNQTDDGQGRALSCEAAKITRTVFLTSANCEGRVVLMGAEIGYALELSNTSIRNPMIEGRPALQCQGAKIKGNVHLGGFVVEGGASFAGAEIEGQFDCASAKFLNLVAEDTATAGPDQKRAQPALALQHARIIGPWILRRHEHDKNSTPCIIQGSVELTGAHVGALVDDAVSWPEPIAEDSKGKKLSCTVELDGFTYNRFSQGAPTDAKYRLTWLSLQPRPHLSTDFRPQPFEQLIKVLREMGHEPDARQVAIDKLRNRREARLNAATAGILHKPSGLGEAALQLRRSVAALFVAAGVFLEWLIVDLILGSGYAKLRPVLLFTVMLLGCAGFYRLAAERSGFAPTSPAIYNNADYRKQCAGPNKPFDIATPLNWYRCEKMPPEFNRFRPLAYSMDQMIPFLQLGQKRDWQPAGVPLQFGLGHFGKTTLPESTALIVTWFQSISSTMLYLFIVAILSGLIKRD